MKKILFAVIIFTAFLALCLFMSFIAQDKCKINVYYDGRSDENYSHVYANNKIYISGKFLMDSDLLDYYWDDKINRISFFNNYNYININYNDTKAIYDKNSYKTEDVLIIKKNELYFNTDFLKNTFIKTIFVDMSHLNVAIEESSNKYKVVKNSKMKSSAGIFAEKYKDLENGDSVYVYGNEHGGYILARTDDNIIGYIRLSDIMPVSHIKYNKYPSVNRKKEIKLAWDLISKPIDKFEPFYLPESIDIIAPTWFELNDDKTVFNDLFNIEYFNYVKNSGKEICAVFNNGFDPDLSHKLLNDGIKRSQIADKIINITIQNKFDYINIDFENIYLKDKEVFSAFIKELYCKAKSHNTILTIDVAVLSNSQNWSMFFDRNVIAEYSDYIMLMAYDENVSNTIGSVSSLPWIEYGISNLLEYAPCEKVVLGIPFYTRLWLLSKEGKEIKSYAYKIKTAEEKIDELGIQLSYDEKTGQNYGEITTDGVTYKIWNEDAFSINKRLKVARKHNLTGIAVWALSYGSSELWELLK